MAQDLIKSKIAEVADEIRSIILEQGFVSRWALIEAAHQVGELIVKNFGEKMSEVLPTLAKKVDRSARTLYRAAQLYRAFPDISKIPQGKAASLNRILNEYVIESGDKEPCKHENRLNIEICGDCHARL